MNAGAWRNTGIVGKRFGRLTVVGAGAGDSHRKERTWNCSCECGGSAEVTTAKLNSGNTKSCGCLQVETCWPNLTGQTFGRLTVITSAGKRRASSLWLCACSCGNERTAATFQLRSGSVKSCGCLHIEAHGRPAGWLGDGVAMRNSVIRRYSHNPGRLPYTLTQTQAIDLLTAKCHYCNREPSQTASSATRRGTFTYNGIDRLNNQRGYEPGNVVTCCKACNTRKGAAPYREFIAWVAAVANNLGLSHRAEGA